MSETLPPLKINLLGNLRLFWRDDPLPSFPTHKTRALFAYLVVHRQCAHPRTQLAGIFWGDFPENRAQRNLNTTLWRLRHTLPDEYLLVEGDQIAFNVQADYWLDVNAFETACEVAADLPLVTRIAALERALQYYRGDFLAGWYEDWVLVEAERLRLLFMQVLWDLINDHHRSGALSIAIDYTRRLLDTNPLREDAHRKVMELSAMLGNREAALQQYAVCERILQTELGVTPTQETTTLYERIQAGAGIGLASDQLPLFTDAPRPVPFFSDRNPFDDLGNTALVGREQEISVTQKSLNALEDGNGCIILLEGEAGVGKTRLTQELVRWTGSRGITLLWGICPDVPAPSPYQGLIGALRDGLDMLKLQKTCPISEIWLSELTRLLPELFQIYPQLPHSIQSENAEQGRKQLLAAFAHYFDGLASLGPHLIVLEDLHCADAATLEALCYLLTCEPSLPVLFWITFRPEELAEREELSRAVNTIAGLGCVQRFRLQRFSLEETSALIAQVLGRMDDTALVSFIHTETDGNPFFISEVLKYLLEDGYLRLRKDGIWESPWDWGQREVMHLRPPRGIRQTVRRRLRTLSPASRCVLEMAAVIGRDIAVETLQESCSQSEDVVLEATDDLLRRQLLVEDGDQLRFGHDKIRQIVYQGLATPIRRSHHGQVGRVLQKNVPDQIDEIACHFFLAKDYANALPNCMRAGERSWILYANRSALTYFSWAVESARQVDDRSAQHALVTAYARRGRIWEHLGEYDDALSDYALMYKAAEEIGDSAGMSSAVRHSGWVRGDHYSDYEYGLKQAQRAWELAQQGGAVREAALARRDLGAFQNMLGRYDEALEAHRVALQGFREIGDRSGEAASLQYLAVVYQFLSEYDLALDYYEQALALREQLGERWAAAKTLTNIGYTTFSLGRIEAARQAFQQADVTLREIGAQPSLPFTLIGLGACYRHQCQFQVALDVFAEAGEIERLTESNVYVQSLIRQHQGLTHWQLDECSEALTKLQEALHLARQCQVPTLIVSSIKELGRCLCQCGDLGEARTLYEEALALARQASYLVGECYILSELGLALVRDRQFDQGLIYLESAFSKASEFTDWIQVKVSVNLAEGLLIAGDVERALNYAQDTVLKASELGIKDLEAWGCLLIGRILAAKGDRLEAEAAFNRGIQPFDPAYPSRVRSLIQSELSALFPGRVQVRMACQGVPRGRPLRDDEWVKVTWTIDAGVPDAVILKERGKVGLRRERILRLLREANVQGGDPTQVDLANVLGVSMRTIRDDLAALRRQKYDIHTRGHLP